MLLINSRDNGSAHFANESVDMSNKIIIRVDTNHGLPFDKGSDGKADRPFYYQKLVVNHWNSSRDFDSTLSHLVSQLDVSSCGQKALAYL